MKKGILLWAVLPWLCPTLHAQVWCPPGAEWHFEHWGQFGNQLGSVHVQYAADTMVQGVAAKRLSSTASGYDFLIGQPYVFDLPNIITKSDQAQVSRWNGTDWVLLFDLDVPIGGQWTLSGENFIDRAVTVLSTGTVFIQGEPLAFSTVSFTPPFGSLATDSVIERIGFTHLFLEPSRTVALDGDVFGLRCYSDEDIFYSNTGALACDFILGSADPADAIDFYMFPNPAMNQLNVVLPTGSSNALVMVFDSQGKLVLQQDVHANTTTVDIGALAPGLYMLRVRAGAKEFGRSFVKQP